MYSGPISCLFDLIRASTIEPLTALTAYTKMIPKYELKYNNGSRGEGGGGEGEGEGEQKGKAIVSGIRIFFSEFNICTGKHYIRALLFQCIR